VPVGGGDGEGTLRLQALIGVVLAVLVSAQAPAESAAPDRLQRILDSGTLRVGTTMDTPVFSMRKPSGELEGFDIDALATLGPALGVKIDYVKMTFGSMLGDLAADKFDVAMSGMGRTYDSARTATFSKPYLRYGKLMMIRSADKDRFRSLADLDQTGFKIAYNKGGLNETFAKTMFKQASPTGFDSNALATADLLAGKVDAQVADSTAAIYMGRQDPRIAALDPGQVFNPVYVAILLHREDQTLLNYLDIWIDQIDMDGTLAKIRAKWLGEDYK